MLSCGAQCVYFLENCALCAILLTKLQLSHNVAIAQKFAIKYWAILNLRSAEADHHSCKW